MYIFREFKLMCWLIAVAYADICLCFRAERLLEILRTRTAAQPFMPMSILINSLDKNPKALETNNSSMLILLKVVFDELMQ